MKQELKYTLEVEVDGNIFSLIMPANVQLGQAYDASVSFVKVLKQNLDEQNKKLMEMVEKEEVKEEKE